jgi:hypothetical protein
MSTSFFTFRSYFHFKAAINIEAPATVILAKSSVYVFESIGITLLFFHTII